MSAATFTPAPVARHAVPSGAIPFDSARRRPGPGGALRAVGVFAGAAFDVILLGDYAEGEEAGVRRR
ncbi:hypothetical protein GCM10010145_01180 [Streptomyces ruber]|uniref:Uncharacterized protein n=2 Tax=Streptomyces TaxID=1883 RepID=A0A918B646_9ACTN|nr:hypothetical protein [Streptomyces ruber]GGQ37785.1 hypothetical protein GCM10010145_01180 [Streptomyces ruber]